VNQKKIGQKSLEACLPNVDAIGNKGVINDRTAIIQVVTSQRIGQ
jgi:hypothetical protein